MTAKHSPEGLNTEIADLIESIRGVKGPQQAVITECGFNVINIIMVLDSVFGPLEACPPQLQEARKATLILADNVVGNMLATMIALWKNPNNLTMSEEDTEHLMQQCEAIVTDINSDIAIMQAKQAEYSTDDPRIS